MIETLCVSNTVIF